MAACCESLITLASSTNLLDRLAIGLAANQRPGCTDDLFLKLGQPVCLLGVLALLALVLGRSGRGLFALAEDFLKRAHLGEKHIAVGTPGFAVGSDVLGPEIVRDKLVGRGVQRLEVNQVFGGCLQGRLSGFANTISRGS